MATTGLVKTIADFSTTLATGVAVSDTSATLSSATDSDGVALPSGVYAFTVDKDSSSKEYFTCSLSGTALTNVKTLARKDGAETTGFAKKHRKGASIIISDFAAIRRIQDVLETGYEGTYTPTTDYQVANKKYVDDASFAGATNASTTTGGVVELPTQAEVDAGTASGGLSPLSVTPDTLRAKKYHDAVASSVGTDSYAITVSPAITAYATGQEFTVIADVANIGACTLAVSGLTAKDIKKNVSEDLATGDILAGQTFKVVYDGTNFQLVHTPAPIVPIVRTYTISSTATTSYGGITTQFDITNPTGDTYRYTWDSTGTDPNINTTNFPIGRAVMINSNPMSTSNIGVFRITASGTNYFEVENSSGVVESNKTLNTNGYLYVSNVTTIDTWTKPTGLKYVVAEVVGSGGPGGITTGSSGGGGGGGYSRKVITASSLSSTETINIGFRGITFTAAIPSGVRLGQESSFGTHLSASGGFHGIDDVGGIGGVGSNGDINSAGDSGGIAGGSDTGSGGSQNRSGGNGGGTYMGGGGKGQNPGVSVATDGQSYGGGGGGGADSSPSPANGANGIVIVTEYY